MYHCIPRVQYFPININAIHFDKVTVSKANREGDVTLVLQPEPEEQNMLQAWLSDFVEHSEQDDKTRQAQFSMKGDGFSVNICIDSGEFSSGEMVLNAWGKAADSNWVQLRRPMTSSDQLIQEWINSHFPQHAR